MICPECNGDGWTTSGRIYGDRPKKDTPRWARCAVEKEKIVNTVKVEKCQRCNGTGEIED